MQSPAIQEAIHRVLNAYGLPNMRGLQQKAADLKARDRASKEALLLEFVTLVYELDCLEGQE